MTTASRLTGLALACALAVGCEPPPIKPTADPVQSMQNARIEGQVVVQSRARGNAVILLYDAQHPPPPVGSGRPLTFTVIPSDALFGAADSSAGGPFVAPFTFSRVAPGDYLVRGFIDADTCAPSGSTPTCHPSDFIPPYTVTGQPDTGDVGGAAVDALTLQPRVVKIAPDAETGALQAVTGVSVSFSDSSTVPLDPPAFWVDPSASSPHFDMSLGMRLTLKPLVLQRGVVKLLTPRFVMRLVDATGSGQAEVWPKVLVRKVADSSNLLDENDLDDNGILDAQGIDYTGDGVPDRVILGAALDSSVTDPATAAKGAPIQVDSLPINIAPRAYVLGDQGSLVPLPSVPHGRYAVTLVQFTGQSWRVPNDLSQVVSLEAVPAEQSEMTFIIDVP